MPPIFLDNWLCTFRFYFCAHVHDSDVSQLLVFSGKRHSAAIITREGFLLQVNRVDVPTQFVFLLETLTAYGTRIMSLILMNSFNVHP